MKRIVITGAQKKILIVAGIVIAALAIFLRAAYLPMKQEAERLKREIGVIESEIAAIRQMAGEGRQLEAAIGALKTRLDALNAMFPDREEVILRELSAATTRLGIEVVSMRPQRKRAIKDIDGAAIGIAASSVQEMSVSLNVKTNYRSLGDLFKVLREGLPVFVKVEAVTITRIGDIRSGLLNVDLNLNTYLISAQGQ